MAADEKPGKATEESRTERGGGFGPGMGMEMMKKMMTQMGQAGGPMAMMQKMMAQMKPGEGGKPPMEQMMGMCMGMCGEMLATLQQTTAMATFATPELHSLFSEWLDSLERQALSALKEKGELEPAQLAEALKISRDGALYLLARMARQGKASIRARAFQAQ